MELEDTFSSAVGKAPSDGSSLQKKAGAVAAALLVIVVVIFSAGGAEENGAEEADGVSLMGAAAQVDCSNPTAQGVLQSCGASAAPEPRSVACVPPTLPGLLAATACGPGGTRCPVLIDGESSFVFPLASPRAALAGCCVHRRAHAASASHLSQPLAARRCSLRAVRTVDEWNSDGHASCGVRVPVQDDSTLNATVLALAGGDYSVPIVTYCYSGGRAGRAEAVLTAAGFTDVTNGGGWMTGDSAAIEANCRIGSASSSWRWTPDVVSTPDGVARGVLAPQTGTREFFGIPYGASPAGERRFLPPLQNDPWSGVLDARSKRNGCLRSRGRSGEEDCLYVNVYTPTPSAESCPPPGGYPVMVWCVQRVTHLAGQHLTCT